MIATIHPGILRGVIDAPPSKSHMHRLLICAAFADGPTCIRCNGINEDIEATIRCLTALGANILRSADEYLVRPIVHPVSGPELDCGESGSTYRFLLPVVAALGCGGTFLLRGRLPQRPISALAQALTSGGATLDGLGTERVVVGGRFSGGLCEIPGNISSQFISGLLFALPLIGGGSIRITTPVESRGYIRMTADALHRFGVETSWQKAEIQVSGGYRTPGNLQAEGDWSAAAFPLCAAAACGSGVTIRGLNPASLQGDRAVTEVLQKMSLPDAIVEVDLSDIPDLAPALAGAALARPGVTCFTGAARLRLKESDRVQAVVQAVQALGGEATSGETALYFKGNGRLRGGRVNPASDHRIAMMAACCAVISNAPVVVENPECVNKSYPGFWDDLHTLGLNVERSEERSGL